MLICSTTAKLVYGIREAKGLEFKTVIILDFFREILTPLQKPWRELVLNRATQDLDRNHPLIGTLLKLLYTGVTRCIEKLFFVETHSTTAGDATMRWLTTKNPSSGAYATRNNIDDIEVMSMTADEFVSDGINNAELAQSSVDLDQAQLLLERAIWCFEQASNDELAAKGRIHCSCIQFRAEFLSPYDEKSETDRAVSVLESRAAKMMASLIKEGFYFEVLNLYTAISPHLSTYTRDELERRFIHKVQELHGECEEG